MNEPNIPHTSSFACDDLARETLGAFYGDGSLKSAADQVTEKLLMPLVSRICQSGKIPHGKIRQLAKGLDRALQQESSVIAARTELIGSRLSPNDEARITYILGVGEAESAKRDWLDFVTAEVQLKRTSLQMSNTMLDFRIHRHALSRYMQRERKLADRMMENMMQTMEMASLMANVIIAHCENPNCALPLGRAMLFGRVEAYCNKKSPAIMNVMHFERHSAPQMWEEDRQDHLVKGSRGQISAMTYVGELQLTPNREKLRDVLCEFRDRHAEALSMMFQAHYYPGYTSVMESTGAARKLMFLCRNEMIALVTGREWERFTKSVGTGPNG